MIKNKLLILVLSVTSFFAIVFGTIYFAGIRKYGTPSSYRNRQFIMLQAREDSIRALKAMAPSGNIADSTMMGMSVYSKLVTDASVKEEKLTAIQAAIDSLRQYKMLIESKESDIEKKQEELKTGREILLDETVEKLASLYNIMKPALAVPLFIEMDDTLAVKIIARMEERSAARIMEMLAEKDVNKATRINKLLSMKEVAK